MTAIVIMLAVLPIQVCRDWAFVCENTGSKKGNREWIFGLKTGHWYIASPLEGFMRKHAVHVVSHRWTSYAGTGKTMIGRVGVRGHGRPGVILQLDHEILEKWIEKHDASEVRRLYDLFVSDNQTEIEVKIRNMLEEVLQ